MDASPQKLNVSARFPSFPSSDTRKYRWLSLAMSIGLIGVILGQFEHVGLTKLRETLPQSAGFWIALATYYLALPGSEWIIYRRLWKLPASSITALLRKLVNNEVLMGYSGELSFYAWARGKADLTTAPFGAIKDVSISSALSGNIVTIIMILVAWPFINSVHLPISDRDLGVSVVGLISVSSLFALFKTQIFSLPGRDLRFVFMVHFGRLAATTLLSAMMWHFALPAVSFPIWILLATLQLLVTRLPFVPNKDLIFAAAAMMLAGRGSDIATLINIIATLILMTHLVIGAALAIGDLAETTRKC